MTKQSRKHKKEFRFTRLSGQNVIGKVGAVFCSLLICMVLGYSAPSSGFADVRASDTVAGNAIGDTHAMVPDAPDIVGDYAALCTRDSTVLWERNSKTPVPMASTTKIMTAVVALESFSPSTPMTVTSGAAATEGSSADLKEGDSAYLSDLIVCMMVPSGNDAAVVIAENISGTETAFIEKMNAKAAELGMVNTHFSNSSGLVDVDNYTTAADFLILTRAAMANEIFRDVVSSPKVTAQVSGEELTYSSTNLLLTNMQGANGVKTGFTDEAGYCLVASAERNGFELYAVVFHSSDENQRFNDAQTLLEWGFAHYRNVELINSAAPVANLALTSWIDKTVPVVAANPISANIFDHAGQITQEVTLLERDGAIGKGEVVGSIIWSQNGEVIANVDLVSTESVPAPGFWEGAGIWWQRFFGGFTGAPDHATSTTVLPEVFDLQIADVSPLVGNDE